MTAVAVEICSCAHAPRMHERDDDAEHGRGVCAHRSCGCAEYRPGSVEVQEPVIVPAAEPVEEQAPATLVPPPERVFPCPVCGKEFTSPQGAGGHRAKAHPGSATQTGPAAVPPTAAAPAAVVKHGLTMPVTEEQLATATLLTRPATPSTDVEQRHVHPDDVLVGLVRALEAVVDGEPSALLEQALDIRRYMNDRGWRVIDGSPA